MSCRSSSSRAKPRWDRALPGRPGDLLVLDDRLFVGGEDKWFYCLNTKNGDQRWRKRVGGKPAGVPAIDEKRVYYVALDNMLWVLDRGNGVMKWKQALSVRPSGGPIVMGGVVVVSGVAFEIYGYRVDDGEVAGNVDPAGRPRGAAAGPAWPDGGAGGDRAVHARRRVPDAQAPVEPAAIAFPYPLGTEIPLTALVAPAARCGVRRLQRRKRPSRLLIARASRRTPSAICSCVVCEKQRRSVSAPLPSTKKAFPET